MFLSRFFHIAIKHYIIIPSLCITTLLSLFSCSRYDIGDWYNGADYPGVVIQTDESGNPTTILLLDEAFDISADSALVWSSLHYASDKYAIALPSNEEMETIKLYKILINNTLKDKKQLPILDGHTFYWTDSACSETHHYAMGPNGLHCFWKTNHSKAYRARAVMRLSEH